MEMERDLHFSSSFLPFPSITSDPQPDSQGTLHSLLPHFPFKSTSSSMFDFPPPPPPTPPPPTDHYHYSIPPSFNNNFLMRTQDSYSFPYSITHNPLLQLYPSNIKNEPFNFNPLHVDPSSTSSSMLESTMPFDFFSKPTMDHDLNLHLPNLRSLESPSSSSTRKRCRVIDSLQPLQNYAISAPSNPAPVMPNSQVARLRRQKISEKTRSLQKLIPWDKKMDTATTLDEAYKYIRFLQAQVLALQSMPCVSSYISTSPIDVLHGHNNVGWTQNHGSFLDGLWTLNRQQLLQVLVNSSAVQAMLYSGGCCVFSTEQLVLLKEVASRRAVLQQSSTHGDSSKKS